MFFRLECILPKLFVGRMFSIYQTGSCVVGDSFDQLRSDLALSVSKVQTEGSPFHVNIYFEDCPVSQLLSKDVKTIVINLGSW